MSSSSVQQLHLDDEVQFVRETRSSREVITLSDTEDDRYGAAARPIDLEEPFRIMDLPAELRVYIYQYLLPHNLSITFSVMKIDGPGGQIEWRVLGTSKTEDSQTSDIVGTTKTRTFTHGLITHHPPVHKHSRVETQLFLINKAVSNEARAVLYGSNIFKFLVNGGAHYPVSLRSPKIFGPFGNNGRLPLLRNLRSIHIDILLDEDTHWGVERQRSRLEYFVEILKEYADDENRKSLLQELKVEVRLLDRDDTRARLHFERYRTLPPSSAEKFIFGLESLASLQGIKEVEITGPLPEWYANCLRTCIQGKGGEVAEVNWPDVVVKKKSRTGWSGRRKTGMVSTRKWYQPKLNWKEYAERNGIEIPQDIDKFWVAKS